MEEYPTYPDFIQPNVKPEAPEELVLNPVDMMSLKGQVWPGMGKLDLANEEMRRTRNQRKPKSVIDKMKKASEDIEPNQVTMTPDFTIERVRDVYEEPSSPITGQNESVSG